MRIVAGRFRGRPLSSPPDGSIRPTSDRVREAVFNILASRLGPDLTGLRVMDLFAGSGAMGLEALSRGAAHVLFVDNGLAARSLIREHTQAFGVGGQVRLMKRDAAELGPAEKLKPYDLVFLDPPYGQGLGERALAQLAGGGWLAPDAAIVLEERADAALDLPEGFVLDDRRVYGDTVVHFLSRTV